MDLGHWVITYACRPPWSTCCKALPRYLALIGSDCTSPVYRKGKSQESSKGCSPPGRPQYAGRKHYLSWWQQPCRNMSVFSLLSGSIIWLSSVNEARLKVFLRKYKPTDPDSPLEKNNKGTWYKHVSAVQKCSVARIGMVQLGLCRISLEAGTSKMSTEPTDHSCKEVSGVL